MSILITNENPKAGEKFAENKIPLGKEEGDALYLYTEYFWSGDPGGIFTNQSIVLESNSSKTSMSLYCIELDNIVMTSAATKLLKDKGEALNFIKDRPYVSPSKQKDDLLKKALSLIKNNACTHDESGTERVGTHRLRCLDCGVEWPT